MAMIKTQSEPGSIKDYYWDSEEKVLKYKSKDDKVWIALSHVCRDCGKHNCTCGQLYREHTILEIVELIVPMMTFKTSEEVKKIIRMIETRTVLNAPFHNQDSGD